MMIDIAEEFKIPNRKKFLSEQSIDSKSHKKEFLRAPVDYSGLIDRSIAVVGKALKSGSSHSGSCYG